MGRRAPAASCTMTSTISGPFPLWTALISAGLAFVGVKYLSWTRKTNNLPPGPPKLPFIDNLHNMSKGLDWVRFSELGKEYNTDILHLGALGNSLVILNTYEVAKELLEQRAGIFSDRHITTMFKLSGFDTASSVLPYGDRWRVSRRMFHNYFGFSVRDIDQLRESFYARRCHKQLLDSLDDFLDHMLHWLVAVSTAYGLTAEPENDPNLHVSEQLMKNMAAIVDAGIFLVDIFPFLKYVPEWVPGASFQKAARECRARLGLVRDGIFDKATKAMGSEGYLPCLVSEQLDEFEPGPDHAYNVEILKDVAYTVYLGASDTIWSTLGTFLLTMVCYPEIQKKAQQELDSVLDGRLPEHNDLEQLPYLKAIFLEVVRWKPAFPIGLPHSSTMDDIYNGMFIPKGSIVIANAWAMLYDSVAYPNPFEFNPERFLKDGRIDESVRNPTGIMFGFGRRLCPGRHVAQSTFMITAASVLSTFDLLMKLDEKGEVIRPKQICPRFGQLDAINRAVSRLIIDSSYSHPKPFPCKIVPRSPSAKQLVETWAAAEGGSPP